MCHARESIKTIEAFRGTYFAQSIMRLRVLGDSVATGKAHTLESFTVTHRVAAVSSLHRNGTPVLPQKISIRSW